MTEVTQAAKDAAAQFLCRDDGDFPELAMLFQTYGEHILTTALAEAAAIRERCEALEAALRPFADCCDQISEDEDDEEWAKFRLLIKDYRAARAALTKGPTQ